MEIKKFEANKGSGKKPTKAMLEQAKKITNKNKK
jgi:hypothetical protein